MCRILGTVINYRSVQSIGSLPRKLWKKERIYCYFKHTVQLMILSHFTLQRMLPGARPAPNAIYGQGIVSYLVPRTAGNVICTRLIIYMVRWKETPVFVHRTITGVTRPVERRTVTLSREPFTFVYNVGWLYLQQGLHLKAALLAWGLCHG